MTTDSVVAVTAAVVASLCGPSIISAQAPTPKDAFVANLATMTDGAWIASNSEYSEDDGGIESYGIKLDLAPGGLAAVGCLWGEREGQVVGVFWQFFQAWDPVAEKGLIYQSGPSGAIAVGYLDPSGEDDPELVQTMVAPDGTRTRIAHRERWTDANTRVGGSLDWEDGGWVPGRTYTWVRERSRESPC